MPSRPLFISGCALLASACAAWAGVQPGGSPWRRFEADNGALGADGVRFGDLNNDGRPDLITAWEFSGQVRIALNPGGCAATDTWPTGVVALVPQCEDSFAADLDGDGREDLFTCAEQMNRSVYVHWAPGTNAELLNTSAWKTQRFPQVPLRYWMYAAAAQIDGENGPDVFIASKSDSFDGLVEVAYLRSPENARQIEAWTFHVIGLASWATALIAHDMDGDGDIDLVIFDRQGPERGVRWLEHPGVEQLALHQPWMSHRISSLMPATIGSMGDIDGDGLLDIISPFRPNGLFWFERLDSSGLKWEAHQVNIPASVGIPKGASAGDMNLDGRVDIVVSFAEAVEDARGVVLLQNPGNPISPFWPPYDISGPEGEKYDAVPLLDVDGDGDLDVVATDEHDNKGSDALGLVWYQNRAIQLTLDLDMDGFIGFGDLVRVLNEFGQSGHGLSADVTNDGVVDFNDLNLILGYYGQSASTIGCSG